MVVRRPRTRSAFYRALNDDLVRLSRPAQGGVRLIVCECSRPDCAEALEVTDAEYDAVRAHATRFIVVPGHELAGVQRVLERTRRAAVVQEQQARFRRPPSAPNGSVEDDGRRALVLIVDDDSALRALCSLNLQFAGLAVLEAADGLRGLELARRELPALVVSDVRMPRLDGFALGEALRGDERTRRTPLILVSGESDVAGATRAREIAALAYVPKPFDAPALASVAVGVIARFAATTHTATRG
jgi:two-component system chemotaxis response regulator CheY